MSDYLSSLLGAQFANAIPGAASQHANWLDHNQAMQNAFKAPPVSRYPRIDPTKPMSDKAAKMLHLGGLLKVAR